MQVIYSVTSSRGNCSVIESGNGYLLVIDAGIKYQTVDKEIGHKLHQAWALLITHAHADHTAYLKDFMKTTILKAMGIDTFKALKLNQRRDIDIVAPKIPWRYGDFAVTAIEMKHTNADGTPCECYGYLIGDCSTKEKLLWATDTAYVGNKFPALDYYCLESNFFEQEYEAEDMDYFEKSVEQRRLQGHMSFESVLKFLDMQNLSKCKEIRLLHVSSKLSQSAKEKMKQTIQDRYHLEGTAVYV